MRLVRTQVAALAVVPALLAAGCGDDPGTSHDDAELTVLAASSLTEVFETLAEQFEGDHPGVTVTSVFDSSATLATQVQEGAPADVLATADLATMQAVLDSGEAQESVTFATNQMVLITPPDNPGRVESFADLADDSVDFVACVESAPCGTIAADLLARNDISTEPRSLEVDVKAVVTKVAGDEADAGLVYATDARAAGDEVRTFPVPGSEDVLNDYAIAVIEGSEHPDLAREWVELLVSPAGEAVLEQAGFGLPSSP